MSYASRLVTRGCGSGTAAERPGVSVPLPGVPYGQLLPGGASESLFAAVALAKGGARLGEQLVAHVHGLVQRCLDAEFALHGERAVLAERSIKGVGDARDGI